MGLASLLITFSGLAKVLLPIPMTLGSVDLKILVPLEGMLLSGKTTMIPFKWKLRLHLATLCSFYH